MENMAELERMALNAADVACPDSADEPSREQVLRWRQLFRYSESEAVDRIKEQRSDVARARVSNAHWDLV